MEASARASLNFLEQLYLFHRQQGDAKVSIPTIEGKLVDLWRLRREVSRLGGYKQVLFGPICNLVCSADYRITGLERSTMGTRDRIAWLQVARADSFGARH